HHHPTLDEASPCLHPPLSPKARSCLRLRLPASQARATRSRCDRTPDSTVKC
ncbi:unnamed protein product, partial [Mycena citricolor]